MRRATNVLVFIAIHEIISIHALHEESDPVQSADHAACRYISIHALHEESDTVEAGLRWDAVISIHALHEESD